MGINIDMLRREDVICIEGVSYLVAKVQDTSFFLVDLSKTLEISGHALGNTKDVEYTTLRDAFAAATVEKLETK